MLKKYIIGSFVAIAMVCSVYTSSINTIRKPFSLLDMANAQTVTAGELMSLPQGDYDNINGNLVNVLPGVTIHSYGNTGYAEKRWWQSGGYAIRSTPVYGSSSGSNSSSGSGGQNASYSHATQTISGGIEGSSSSSMQYNNQTQIGSKFVCTSVSFSCKCNLANERDVYWR